ncbi:hypothetical protein M2480_002258 [Parabacteroides sp. PFB2-12]|uniref:CIS tube protein n=1 Tax=unclassified Parabacteroides TaxID=2649774 RepID=UPI0024746C26|nr:MULTISPECIES: hypothetical protein [unclassified Parabacteroides]MDH6343905.1 hypothetical protein [Parabacteroides sp. PM6-13]MDH6391267.1 hypothetical protein [Parabacteroides sp. PFB2-12]MDL2309827.1 hypothetical protein [Parabacteroides sp. OttesenSCG-928-B22]
MIAKLNIEVYKKSDYSKKKHTIELQINPEDFKESKSISYEKKDNMSPVYQHHERNTLSISFTIDGTGVVPSAEPVVVSKKVKELEEYLYVPFLDDDTIQTYFVLLKWGDLHFKGRLTKMDVHYTLFKPDGEPLRAKVTLEFVQTGTLATVVVKKKNKPPKKKQVKPQEDDTLICICYRETGETTNDTKVARENNMTSIRGPLESSQNVSIPQ